MGDDPAWSAGAHRVQGASTGQARRQTQARAHAEEQRKGRDGRHVAGIQRRMEGRAAVPHPRVVAAGAQLGDKEVRLVAAPPGLAACRG